VSGSLNERMYAMQDANWNTVAIADASGVVKERYDYTPFGMVEYRDADWNPLAASGYAWVVLFQGMRYDGKAGLYSQRMRCYSPTLGRWASVDIIGFNGGSANLYGFVANNPSVFTDPSGLEKYEIERDVKKDCTCDCIKNPENCSISIIFMKKDDTFIFHYTAKGTDKRKDEKTTFGGINSIYDDGKSRRIFVRFPVLIKIESKTGKDVTGCHLHQDVIDRWGKQADGKINDLGPKKDDYSAKGDKDNLYYGGWWLHDIPKRDSIARNEKGFGTIETHFFWQAHVYIEEAPKVEMYWGWQVQADYTKAGADKDAAVERVTFGPEASKKDNPYTKKPQ